MSKKFACVPDAENDAKIWISAHPHHSLKNLQIQQVMEKVGKRRERPKKNEALSKNFKIFGEIEANEIALAEERRRLVRFVLASNGTDLVPEVMLNYYKGQQAVERGFRFMKDKCIHDSEVYLKKGRTNRIAEYDHGSQPSNLLFCGLEASREA